MLCFGEKCSLSLCWPRRWIALSRDQEDIAGLFKRMAFGGVRIVTLSEGDVTHLHVGLKGTMNALFLKDLAQDAPWAARPRRGWQVRWRAVLRL